MCGGGGGGGGLWETVAIMESLLPVSRRCISKILGYLQQGEGHTEGSNQSGHSQLIRPACLCAPFLEPLNFWYCETFSIYLQVSY